MSTKSKRLLIALFFFILAVFSLVAMFNQGFSSRLLLYTLIFGGICFLFVKNAIRP
jgi:hypothetical protein